MMRTSPKATTTPAITPAFDRPDCGAGVDFMTGFGLTESTSPPFLRPIAAAFFLVTSATNEAFTGVGLPLSVVLTTAYSTWVPPSTSFGSEGM